MRTIHLVSTAAILLCACNSANLLTYKYRIHFSEENTFSAEVPRVLYQEILYNDPRSIDEEYDHTLKIRILDSSAVVGKKVIRVEQDTAIVQLEYSVTSVWNWADENNTITGALVFLRWTPDAITLREHIVVNDHRRNRVKVFKGRRVFRRASDG